MYHTDAQTKRWVCFWSISGVLRWLHSDNGLKVIRQKAPPSYPGARHRCTGHPSVTTLKNTKVLLSLSYCKSNHQKQQLK